MDNVVEGELTFVGRGNPAPSKYYIVRISYIIFLIKE